MKMIMRFGLFSLVSLLPLVATAQENEPLTLENLRVIDQVTYDLPVTRASQNMFLSPDGTSLALLNNANICVYPVTFEAPFEADFCIDSLEAVDGRFSHFDGESTRWAPDSRSFVIAQRAFQYAIDSDIWQVDLQTQTITNLTDDGVADSIISEDFTGMVDVAPSWSPDSEWVYFIRYAGEDRLPELHRVSRDGETTELVQALTPLSSYAIFAQTISPDGEQVAYNYAPSARSIENEVNLADLNSGDVTRIFISPNPAHWVYAMQYAPDGTQLMVNMPMYFSQYGMTVEDIEASVPRILSLENDGDFQYIDPERLVIAASWSPDGSMIAYLAHDVETNRIQLYVTDEVGSSGRVILEGDFITTSLASYGMPLVWAENNVIALTARQGDFSLILIQLGSDAS